MKKKKKTKLNKYAKRRLIAISTLLIVGVIIKMMIYFLKLKVITIMILIKLQSQQKT